MLRSIDVIIFQSDIILKRIEKSLENWKHNSVIRLLSTHLITVFTSITAFDRFSYNGFKLWHAHCTVNYAQHDDWDRKQTNSICFCQDRVWSGNIKQKQYYAVCIELCISMATSKALPMKTVCIAGLISRFISNSSLIWPFQQIIPSLRLHEMK